MEQKPDIFEIFEEQHTHVKDQLKHLAEAADHLFVPNGGPHLQNVIVTFAFLKGLIEEHNQAEDKYLLPVLEEHIVNGDLPKRLKREHEQVRRLLTQMENDIAALGTWRPVLQVKLENVGTTARSLVALMEDHIAFERNQIFPIAREVLSPDDQTELGRNLSINP